VLLRVVRFKPNDVFRKFDLDGDGKLDDSEVRLAVCGAPSAGQPHFVQVQAAMQQMGVKSNFVQQTLSAVAASEKTMRDVKVIGKLLFIFLTVLEVSHGGPRH
jgi:hypothetical protein